MYLPYLDTHKDSALALYRQRQDQQQLAVIHAQVMARHEQLLWTHLHVLSRCQPDEELPTSGSEADLFVALATALLSPDPTRRESALDHTLALLAEPEEVGRAAFEVLALLAPPEAEQRTLDLYQTAPELRPTLFDLWREQSRIIPPGLVSVAELRGQDPELQIAALSYAANQPHLGLELFTAYYQGLLSGAERPDKSGHLLATALWGGALRGEQKLAKPLWRCIESESDPNALYHLLRLGAILADPQLIPVLEQYGEQSPKAAELLALHGTQPALQVLLDWCRRSDPLPSVVEAWHWVSGRPLNPAPHLRLVKNNEEPEAPSPHSIDGWWEARGAKISENQRLLWGEPLSLPHLIQQCQEQAGRFSHNLLDLLSYRLGAPIGITGNALQLRRQAALQQPTVQQGLEEIHDSAG